MVPGGDPRWIRTQEHITHGAQVPSVFKVLYLFLSPSEQLPLTLKLFTCDKDDVFFLILFTYLSFRQKSHLCHSWELMGSWGGNKSLTNWYRRENSFQRKRHECFPPISGPERMGAALGIEPQTQCFFPALHWLWGKPGGAVVRNNCAPLTWTRESVSLRHLRALFRRSLRVFPPRL